MFAGVSAFPLTPVRDEELDEDALGLLVARAAEAGVDSVGVLGSTGNAPYLSVDERRRVVERAVLEAGDVPVLAGVGALRSTDVVALALDAADAGAAGMLLAPVSYHPLTEAEVLGLYEDVTSAVPLPLVVYENPRTTGVTFSDELWRDVAALPHVVAVKSPGAPGGVGAARDRVAHLRSLVPTHVGVGASGDAVAVAALAAGADTWWSVLAGVAPGVAVRLARAVRERDDALVTALADALGPALDLVTRRGGVRVAAALAEHRGLVDGPCLPRPLRGLDGAETATADAALAAAERL
ncbi:dihydrodipicolinate synthase family protein [Cellulomonas oligotrophica]|uniref:4-hydroxy-tetrahydrodipicolinate synthase n=1 Tax=Cellulomonas oligotrophica TaxID=931536 RepID=A0A7Y9FGE4_9CELL|nr:dihydrodipicolinate synthase family protein [Cellulomonas oligotrophica]NYD86861.1 4-hydroxy-tetrahydrodipicolinate synthase [Cellulomonas oligotrophica]GIG32353.1 dihydrodipicolinate synthase family protein [Cellulomonas oligotrophica]